MANIQQLQLQILFACIMVVGFAIAQGYPGFDSYPSYAPSPQARGLTDTGPVTFPPTSIGSETSGVVVGASNFGFVPPGQNSIGAGRGFGGGYRGPSPSPFFYF